jgi:hypothetical protein
VGDAFDQGGFAGTEIASEEDELWCSQHWRNLATECNGFLRRECGEFANVAEYSHKAV